MVAERAAAVLLTDTLHVPRGAGEASDLLRGPEVGETTNDEGAVTRKLRRVFLRLGANRAVLKSAS